LRTVLYTLASKWEDYGKIKSILYTITDLSRISGICQDRLNLYMEQGLLVPSYKDEAGNPLFNRQSVIKANRIHILSDQDFSVSEIMKKLY